MCKIYRVCFLFLFPLILAACRRSDSNSCIPVEHPAKLRGHASVLLFDGNGTSPCDVVALEAIMDSAQLDYATINSAQLNALNESQFSAYPLLLMPGGNFIDIGKGLTAKTAANIHNAVHNGLNYLGICAGGFLAGKSAYYNGFNLTGGIKFDFYVVENKNIHKATVPITIADGSKTDQYWQDGPLFTGWGSVIAKYPDGTPAIVEGTLGTGRIILAGIHAEAAEDWRPGMNFVTSADDDNAYAAKLIRAAMQGSSLPHY